MQLQFLNNGYWDELRRESLVMLDGTPVKLVLRVALTRLPGVVKLM